MATRFLLLLFVIFILLSCGKQRLVYLQRKDIIEAVYASGKIIPANEYSCYAQGTGTIIRKLVTDGAKITKGQLLYIIRNEAPTAMYQAAAQQYHEAEFNLSTESPLLHDATLALTNASLRLTNDSVTYFRWNTLWAQGIGTRSNLDNAYTNYQVSANLYRSANEKYQATLHSLQTASSAAHGQVVTAKKELGDYFVTAATSGIAWQTFKEAGESVRSNEVVAIMGDSGRPVIRLAVDQEDISRIRTGQNVLLKTDLTGDSVYEAVTTRIYPTMNEADQTFRVDAAFKGKVPPAFIHGSVEANIIVAEKTAAMVLQREAMASRDSVWIADGRAQKKVPVHTGLSNMDYVEILGGINEKTPVIVNAQTIAK